MSDTAIRITDLSKSYSIRHETGQRATNLGEAIAGKLRKPFQRAETEEFWALKDINLEIKKGEVVGVIGRNGAGKSTLLKVLSRITEPTTGKIELFGRVGSLLEVGTGFHPELTGRENIFLNGAILGMRRPEIKRQFDEIVDFAGVEKFLDTPVKRYSSGMYVRLAFAVAAHLNPEILIVDEVLAVGDTAFQKKCLGKMKDVAAGGRTVLFVSHNMQAIETLCNQAVLLDEGAVRVASTVTETLAFYASDRTSFFVRSSNRLNQEDGKASISSFEMLDAAGKQIIATRVNAPFQFRVGIKSDSVICNPQLGIAITNWCGQRMCRLNTQDSGFVSEPCCSTAFICNVQGLPLRPGHYSIAIGLADGDDPLDRVDDAFEFEILPTDLFGNGRSPFGPGDTIFARNNWTCI